MMDAKGDLLEAEKALGAGKPGLAEVLAWRSLNRAETGAAWNMIGRCAMAVGARGAAVSCLRRALALEPYFKAAAKNLQKAEALPQREPPKGRSYLVMREWGYGFWADVSQVLGGLVMAEATGRTPVVIWGRASRFRSGESTDNAWPRFFEPVSDATEEELACAGDDVFPAKWRGGAWLDPNAAQPPRWSGPGSRVSAVELLERPERVAVLDFLTPVVSARHWLAEGHPWAGLDAVALSREVFARHVRPSGRVAAEVDRLEAALMGGSRALGVHIRGTDKQLEATWLGAIHREILKSVRNRMINGRYERLLLITDSVQAEAEYRAEFGARVAMTPARRSAETAGIHHEPHADREALGMEVAVDAWLAARCEAFVGMAYSNVSAAVGLMKPWAEGSLELIGDHMYREYNPMPFQVEAPPGM